jgi:hypothetical protein
LRGHLLLEGELDQIISIILFHPEYILGKRGRFGFEQKVRIARSMSRNADKHHHWDLLLAVNSLRNEIAHKPESEKRGELIRELHRQVRIGRTPSSVEKREQDSERDTVVLACALCSGFLGCIEEDLCNLRGEIEQLCEPD